MSQAERALLSRCRRGEQRAWAELHRQYSPRVAVFVRGMMGPDGEIEDLVQQAFLELMTSLDRFRGEASLATWLHRLASRVVARELRSRGRHRRRVASYARERAAVHAPDLEARAEAVEDLRRVGVALETLPVGFREVWVMRELQGMDVSEVAEVLRVKPATVRTRHHRARALLLAALSSDDPLPELPPKRESWFVRLVRGVLRRQEAPS